MVYLTTISMYYVLYKMGNSKSETESMKIKKLKIIVIHPILGGISSSVLLVFFTDKFALSQSDAGLM